MLHLAPQYRERPEEMERRSASDEFDAQGFPSEDLDSEILLPDAAFENEDYAYEDEAAAQDSADEARGYMDEAGYYPPQGAEPQYAPAYGGGGGGGMPYYPQQPYAPPPVPQPALPTTTPVEVTTFVTALQACQATAAQAQAAVTALTNLGMAAAAATIVSMYQAQAARCAQTTTPTTTGPRQVLSPTGKASLIPGKFLPTTASPSGSGVTRQPVTTLPGAGGRPATVRPVGAGRGQPGPTSKAGGKATAQPTSRSAVRPIFRRP